MIRHIAFLKWREGTTDEQIAAVESALGRMPQVMPFVRRYEMGRDLGLTGSHDFAIVADFDSAEDYLAYADHPQHRQVSSETIGPILESSARLQYTL